MFFSCYRDYQYYFRSEQKIECRDADDLSQILHTHTVAPHKPGALCAATPSTLLYVDWAFLGVHRLDLAGGQPKQVEGKNVCRASRGTKHICLARDEDKELLISAGDERLFAQNTETNVTEWEVFF